VDNDDLWDQVEAVRAQAEIPLTGELIDNNGRSWPDMTLLQFRPDDRVDRGRVISLAYTVHYIRLAN